MLWNKWFFVLGMSSLWAAPSGMTVVSGSVSVDLSNTAAMVVTQSSQQAIVEWESFSLGDGEAIQFVLPASSASMLNRVKEGVSTLNGTMTSNGVLCFVNDLGISIGGAMSAPNIFFSTYEIANANFLNRIYSFSIPADSAINLSGSVTASSIIQMTARQIGITGPITAVGGRVSLVVPSSQGTFTLDGTVRIDDNGVIDVSGTTGGSVFISSPTLSLVNFPGLIFANGTAGDGGEIYLYSDTNVEVDGELQAKATGSSGNGGFIELSSPQFVSYAYPYPVSAASGGISGAIVVQSNGM